MARIGRSRKAGPKDGSAPRRAPPAATARTPGAPEGATPGPAGGGLRVEPHEARVRVRRAHERDVQHPGQLEVGHVPGAAGDLLERVDPPDRLPDDAQRPGAAHAVPPRAAPHATVASPSL